MKKHFLSVVIGLAVSAGSFSASADNLADIYQLALKHDPQLLQAEAQRRAAQKNVDIANASFWPQIQGQAGYARSKQESAQANDQGNLFVFERESDGWDAQIQLSQTLFNMGVWEQSDIAEKQAYQAEVSYYNAKQQLMLRVVNAYFTVLQRKDDLSFATAEKRAIERQLEQTKQRFSVGLTAITDVHEAQAQFDSAVAAEIQAQNAVEVARESLREITGQYHRSLASLDTDKFSPVSPSPATVDSWIKLAEEKSLTLMVERVTLDIAEQQIDLAKSGHYPTVSLDASYGTSDMTSTISSEGVENETNLPRLDSQSIGINLNVPIFSGFRTTAETEQARENYVAASEELERVRRSVEREVRTAFYDVVASMSSIKALEQAVVSAESALKATQAGFEVGTRTIVDVLQSTRNLFNARRNLSEARYGYIRQILTLKQQSGNIEERDLIAISQSLSENAQGTAAE
ncbi:outer membrane channel protein TolC [Idiomarina xiamenensis]|uniref:Protein CyaE n=1 Tax=Idiomarina xiamenensis 10-D-4 TaxID=740709 RepID=K2KAY6_9GAMM|nr:outer membrane channel protein TolC [Idiomarina xiamenensis]EKE83697.1 outer membrane channel protein [Idiomarina xiamenensis 10-D-4]